MNSNLLVRAVACAILLPVAGCTSETAPTESTSQVAEPISVEYNSRVVGKTTALNFDDNQAESVVSVNKDANGNRVVTVTYNDTSPPVLCLQNGCFETDNFIHTTAGASGTRYVQKGATQLGWSYSTNDGQTWTNKPTISPPAGWSVLWGDPAIATCPAGGCTSVYITSLAISTASFDAHSVPNPTYGPSLVGSFGGVDSPLDGACIARSTDGGKNFAIQQCVTNAGHFYDGGSVAVGSSTGPIFAAFVDTNTNLIDVWKSPAPGQAFVRIQSPPLSAATHPRIRADGSNLYVATTDSNGAINMSLWSGSSWSAPFWFANGMGYPSIGFSAHAVRGGPQFSFEIANFTEATGGGATCGNYTDCVNAVCPGGAATCLARCINKTCVFEDQVRLAYTYKDASNKLKVGVRTSGLDLAWVHDVPEWGTAGEAGDQYNPVISAFRGQVFVAGVSWHMAYQTRASDPSGNTVTLRHSHPQLTGSFNQAFTFGQDALPYETVCPDLRSGGAGYWGDYNDIAWLGFTSSLNNRWIATYTDSTNGCPTQYNFSSTHAHVGAVVVDN